MKKVTKVFLVISLILALTGLLACFSGIGLGFRYGDLSTYTMNRAFKIGSFNFDWNWFNRNNQDWKSEDTWDETSEYTWDETNEDDWDWTNENDWIGDDKDWTKKDYSFSAAEIENIDIEYAFGEVKIEPSDSDLIEVSANYRSIWNTYTRKINCETQGNTLKIEDNIDSKLLNIKPWNTSGNTSYLTIKIPKSKYYKEFKLDTKAGSVMINTDIKGEKLSFEISAGEMYNALDGSLNAEKEVDLKAGAGSIKLKNITTADLSVDCGVGEVILEDVKAGDTKLECGVGSVAMGMRGSESDYNYHLESALGSVVIGNSSMGGIGSSKNIDNNGANDMEIKCGIGEISISFQE